MVTVLKQTSILTITLSDQPDKAETTFISRQIKAFNDEVSPHHRAIRPVGTKPLNIFVRTPQQEIVGGLTASTYWGWLSVDDFWLSEDLRGQGLGREILLAAEREATARGCRWAKLSTFSFQAREFYEKLDYRVVGQLDDFPPGASFYWLRKNLDQATNDN